MSEFKENPEPESNQPAENVTVYVGFPERAGVQQVNLRNLSPDQLAEKSAEALDKAMSTITAMAQRAGELGEKCRSSLPRPRSSSASRSTTR